MFWALERPSSMNRFVQNFDTCAKFQKSWQFFGAHLVFDKFLKLL